MKKWQPRRDFINNLRLEIKKNKTASKPKKVNKKPDELDVSPNNVLDINDDVSEDPICKRSSIHLPYPPRNR